MEHHFNFHVQQTTPPTSMSPPSGGLQSVPGRRTPLGNVGLGGFYAQPHASSSASHHVSTDENKPRISPEKSMASMEHPGPSGMGEMSRGKQKNRQGKAVRLNINARYDSL
jgi:hypothetical protein